MADGVKSIRTIGDFIDAGYDYTVTCSDCGRHNNLNLVALAERLGRDHSALASDLSKRMRCKVCGSKRMTFNIRTGEGWDGSGGHGNYS
jgi:DNA-directed RNA polymerase subunit RPC12/RpoP